MKISNNLRKIRQEKELTQKQLSVLSGIAEPTIRQYEAGTLNPKFETIEKFAKALGVDAMELNDDEVIIREDEENMDYRDFINKRFNCEDERMARDLAKEDEKPRKKLSMLELQENMMHKLYEKAMQAADKLAIDDAISILEEAIYCIDAYRKD